VLVPDDARDVETSIEIIVYGACAQTFALTEPNNKNCLSPPSNAVVEHVFTNFFNNCK
jgi:hypothetical protein